MSHLFLTGASGLVGGEFLDRALARGVRVTCLHRHLSSVQSPRTNQNFVYGDLSNFNLDTRDITAILHCAANTHFGLSLDEIRISNVEGTQRVLEFARRCPKLQRFGYVSTVFSCGCLETALMETRWLPITFSNSYQQSKWEAEELIFESMRDIPAAIYRLSSIFGDSNTGVVQRFNYTHQLLRFLPWNVLPVVPGIADAPVDLIATDWAAEALFQLFVNRFESAKVFHICAGPQDSLTVEELLDLAVHCFESDPNGSKWLPIHPPKLVSLREYEALVEATQRGEDRLLRELIRVLSSFLPHLGMRQEFHRNNTRAALPELAVPRIRDYFAKTVSYCLATNWGRNITIDGRKV